MTDEQRQRIWEIENSCDGRTELAERIVGLEDENAKLVDVLHEVEEDAVLAYNNLQSDIELLIKSETEFIEKWWHSECRNDNKLKRIEVLEAENRKLRELLKNALTYIEYEGCGVECPETGNSATLTSCDMCNRYETEGCAYVIEQDARELGIEVDDG